MGNDKNMTASDKIPCPKCEGYIYDNKCVKCKTVYNNADLHKVWLSQFKEVYDIDKEEDGKE